MARDPKKQQKDVMKRRHKLKEAAKKTPALSVQSPLTLLRKARTFPITECLINEDWQDDVMNLVNLVVTREQPDHDLTFGVFLVDRGALGLKNTFCDAAVSPSRYREEIIPAIPTTSKMVACPPALAHQIIYQAIDYAAKLGFKPQKDYRFSQLVLEPRGSLPETADVTFGQDGKPLFIPGPFDNVRSIVSKLDAAVGPGNYNVFEPSDPAELTLPPA